MREIMKEGRVSRDKFVARRNEKAVRKTGRNEEAVVGKTKPAIRYESVDKPVRITLAEGVKVVDSDGQEYLLSAGEKITAYPAK